jgi:hypothetical protein
VHAMHCNLIQGTGLCVFTRMGCASFRFGVSAGYFDASMSCCIASVHLIPFYILGGEPAFSALQML